MGQVGFGIRSRLMIVATLAIVATTVLASVDGAGAASGLGQPCGGRLGMGCIRGLFCDFRAGTCGNDQAEGTCVRIPRFCVRKMAIGAVCGCNGKTYPNDCQRRQAVVPKQHNGRC